MDDIIRQRPTAGVTEPEFTPGLVLSVRGKWAVVMARGGALVRVRVPISGAQPGDVIVLPDWAQDGNAAQVRRLVRVAAVALAAVALVLAGMSAVMFLQPLPAVAMVSIDINPGFILGVNSLFRVVSVQASDADADALIRDLHPGRRPLAEVLHDLLALVDLSTLESSEALVIVGAGPAPGQAELPASFLEGVNQAAAMARRALGAAETPGDASRVEIVVVPTSSLVAEAASRAGVPLGRYAVMLALAEMGADEVHIGSLVSGAALGALREAGIGPREVTGLLSAPGQLKKLLDDHGPTVDQAAASSRPPHVGPGRPDSPPGLDIAPGPPGSPPGDQDLPGDDPPDVEDTAYPVIEGGPQDARGRALEVLERLEEMLGRRPGAQGREKPGGDEEPDPSGG